MVYSILNTDKEPAKQKGNEFVMADSFTVFEKFGDVCAMLEPNDRKELIYAINMYGMFGEEVELPYHLAPLFVAFKEDIDNSKAARARGSMGGRPKSKPRVSESKKQEVAETQKPEVSQVPKPEVSEVSKPQVYEFSQKVESQTKPIQTNTNQTNKRERRFTPPSLQEVREHCTEKGYTFDPEQFFAFYESKGWKVGSSPMKSWRAACTTWQKRQPQRAEVTRDAYSAL